MARASFHTLEMLSSPVLRERTEANMANKIMVQCAITSQTDTFISFLSVRGHLRINLVLYDTPTYFKIQIRHQKVASFFHIDKEPLQFRM